MIVTALAALLGSYLGCTLHNRAWAMLSTIGLAGFAHALLVLTAIGWIGSGGDAGQTLLLLSFSGGEPLDLYATVLAGGLSALFASLMIRRKARPDAAAAAAAAAFERASLVSPSGQRIDALLNR